MNHKDEPLIPLDYDSTQPPAPPAWMWQVILISLAAFAVLLLGMMFGIVVPSPLVGIATLAALLVCAIVATLRAICYKLHRYLWIVAAALLFLSLCLIMLPSGRR